MEIEGKRFVLHRETGAVSPVPLSYHLTRPSGQSHTSLVRQNSAGRMSRTKEGYKVTTLNTVQNSVLVRSYKVLLRVHNTSNKTMYLSPLLYYCLTIASNKDKRQREESSQEDSRPKKKANVSQEGPEPVEIKTEFPLPRTAVPRHHYWVEASGGICTTQDIRATLVAAKIPERIIRIVKLSTAERVEGGLLRVSFPRDSEAQTEAFNEVANNARVRHKLNTFVLLSVPTKGENPTVTSLQPLVVKDINGNVAKESIQAWISSKLPTDWYCPITAITIGKEGYATFRVWHPEARSKLLQDKQSRVKVAALEGAIIVPEPYPDFGDKFSLYIHAQELVTREGVEEESIIEWVELVRTEAEAPPAESVSLTRDRTTNSPTGRIFLSFNKEEVKDEFLNKVKEYLGEHSEQGLELRDR